MDYWYHHNSKKTTIERLINNGLKFVPLRNFIVYYKTGKTLYGKERKFSDKGLRFLHATNITDIGINYIKDEKFIDRLSKMNFPNAYVKIRDILFVRVGVGCAGRVAIVDSKEDEGVATDYIHIIKIKNVDPYFLTVYLKTRLGKSSIEVLKHGVGTVSINKSDVFSIPIPVLSEEIQNDIGMRYRNILKEWKTLIYNKQTAIGSNLEDKMKILISDLERILENYGK